MKRYYMLNVKLNSGIEFSVKVKGENLEEVERCLETMEGYSKHTIVSAVNQQKPHTKHLNGISAARIEKGWTQQDLADAIGVAQQHIQRWEAGVYKPKTAVLMKIGEALGVDWASLVEPQK